MSMNNSMRRLALGATFLALAMTLCLAPAVAAQSRSESTPGWAPIPVNVLLLIPERFKQFTYKSSIKGKETDHAFGEQAEDQFGRILGSAFDLLVIRPVGGEAEALAMLSPESPDNAEVRTFDYVAIPKFISATSWSKTFRYQFEIEILLELHATDNSTVTRIKGYGRTTAGNLASTTPLRAGNRVLWNAIDAIRDGLEGKRDVLIPVSGSVAFPMTASGVEAPPEAEMVPDVDPVPVSVLLLVPDEFRAFVYTSSVQGMTADHAFGEEAEEQMGTLLYPVFQSMVMKPVGSDSEVRDMLSPDSPDNAEVKDFDYVAVPKFTNVHSWTDESRFGFQIDLLVELHSTNGLEVIRIKGYGDYGADVNGAFAPTAWEAGSRSLELAIKAIRETIDRRRELFASL
jgi:hypothetical protein